MARERLEDRYLRIRIEPLCALRSTPPAEMLEFLELAEDPAVAPNLIAVPTSLGRWRAESPETIAALEEHGGRALVELGQYERSAG